MGVLCFAQTYPRGQCAGSRIDPEPADTPSTDSTDHSDLPEQRQEHSLSPPQRTSIQTSRRV